jgi:hypothetical protein
MAPLTYPPYQQPVTDGSTGLASKPWQHFFLSLVAVDHVATVIPPGSLTFDKVQAISSPRLLGRGSSGTGPVEQITLGAALAMSGTLLNVTPGIVVPAPHHLTHEPGGSDAITALDGSVITTGTVAMARLPLNLRTQTLTFVIAHFTSPGNNIATGFAGVLVVPWACTITQVTLLSADPAITSGSIVIDIWKDSYTNYPPTVADSICASAKPTLSSAIKSQDATLTGWTTTIAAGEILGFNVDSVSSVKRVRVDLQVTLT